MSTDYEPTAWSAYFDHSKIVELNDGKFNLFTKRSPSLHSKRILIWCVHGAGFSGLSFAPLAKQLSTNPNLPLDTIAVDLRGHGLTKTNDDQKLDLETLVDDNCRLLIETIDDDEATKSIILVGHSLGGSVVVGMALGLEKKIKTKVQLTVVIDVVEGHAKRSLAKMPQILDSYPKSFPCISKAIEYLHVSGQINSISALRVSGPGHFRLGDDGKVHWRIDLRPTSQFWLGWFDGMSENFLKITGAKMLILSQLEILDKTLTIGQMQGAFQIQVIPGTGHAIHEDNASAVADTLLTFVNKYKFILGIN